MSVIFFTDSCADLPLAYYKQHNLRMIPLSYKVGGAEYPDDCGQTISYHDFYELLRNGAVSSTSQINSYVFEEQFRPLLQEGHDIFYIAFSSALSGTCECAMQAAQTLREDFPEREITVFDTKCASMGQGLIIHYALKLRDEGKSVSQILEWLTQNHLNFAHWFTVGDLNYLRRGGRVTATAAFLGTMLNIKPVLHVDNAGRLVPKEKVKGRARSLKTLVDQIERTGINPAEQTMFISHGDNPADAELVASMIRERFGTKDFMISNIGCVVGSHAGPDTIALFFLAKSRD